MMTRSLLAAAVGLLASTAVHAEQKIDMSGSIGYDTNPFELADEVGKREALFVDGEVTVSAEGQAVKGWRKRADIGFIGRAYERDDEDADQGRLYVRARGGTEEKPDKQGYDWSLRSQARDQTYVSRLTGDVATDDLGNEIGDRYDSLAADLEGEWRFPVTRFGRFSVGVNGTYKNYWYDYESLGLDQLDYYEYGVMPGLEMGPRADRLRLRLTAGQRNYVDRRVSDSIGNPVAGTDLEYRYYGMDVRAQHRLTRHAMLELTADYELRDDNGVGFGDRTQWSVAAEWNWRSDEGSRLALDTRYRSRVLDNQATGDTTINDEAPEKKGYEISLKYSRPFPFLDIRGFSLIAEAAYESYDNNDDERFVYDRVAAMIGVRQQFE